eukprot:666621-Alexandrium_andersonii.AAC.1
MSSPGAGLHERTARAGPADAEVWIPAPVLGWGVPWVCRDPPGIGHRRGRNVPRRCVHCALLWFRVV